MKTLTLVARVSLGITGAVLVLLGIAFWTGHVLQWIPVHAFIGLLFVVSLWVLSILGFRAGVNRSLAASALIWGLIVAVIGAKQMVLFPGKWHWTVQVIHLLIGVIAMLLGVMLSKRIMQHAA